MANFLLLSVLDDLRLSSSRAGVHRGTSPESDRPSGLGVKASIQVLSQVSQYHNVVATDDGGNGDDILHTLMSIQFGDQ